MAIGRALAPNIQRKPMHALGPFQRPTRVLAHTEAVLWPNQLDRARNISYKTGDKEKEKKKKEKHKRWMVVQSMMYTQLGAGKRLP